jgi:hypothetical protein
MSDSLVAETVRITGAAGDEIEAYLARPSEGDTSRGGVVVIHHMPGYDRASKEIVRRFAESAPTFIGARRPAPRRTTRRQRREQPAAYRTRS